ncbi:MAG: hypothetical protein P1T08_10570 [Acidimicrobiia bacterium]|nr:hypothetical protein [Acidimicrobiia bacterium]
MASSTKDARASRLVVVDGRGATEVVVAATGRVVVVRASGIGVGPALEAGLWAAVHPASTNDAATNETNRADRHRGRWLPGMPAI